jgi:hypothetical protein
VRCFGKAKNCKKKEKRYLERDVMQRQLYLKRLRELIKERGSDNVVYFDESGFKTNTGRLDGWAVRGKKIYADVKGRREKRTNLLMAQHGKEWLAPFVFKGSCTSKLVEGWLQKFLMKELNKPSIIVMDNAPVHRKNIIKEILEKHGHILLALPKYSPDFNPIEQSFGAMKKRRQSMDINSTVEDLVMSYF